MEPVVERPWLITYGDCRSRRSSKGKETPSRTPLRTHAGPDPSQDLQKVGGGKVFVRLLWQSKLCVKIANNNYSYYDYHSARGECECWCDEVGFCLIALPLCNTPRAVRVCLGSSVMFVLSRADRAGLRSVCKNVHLECGLQTET